MTPRTAAIAGSLTGMALLLCLAVPYVSTGFMALFGPMLVGPNPDGDMFHGLWPALIWWGSSGLALLLVLPLAAATLVLDVLTVIRAIRSRTVLGMQLIPLLTAWLVGTALVTTPVLLVISGLLQWTLGDAEVVGTLGTLVLMALLLLPFLGRAAQLVLALRLPRSPA